MQDEREALLTVARLRFHEKGLKGVSLEDLAVESGLPIEVVRQHFPEKMAIVFLLMEEDLAVVAKEAMATLPETNIDVQLKHLLKVRFEFFLKHKHSATNVMREVFFSREGWRDCFDTMLWRFSVGVVALFQAAKRRGEIRQDADETVAARAIISYYMISLAMALRGDLLDADNACEFMFPLMDALVESLR